MGIAQSRLTKLVTGLSVTSNGHGEERRGARRVAIVTRGVVRIVDGARERRFSVLTRDISASGVALIAAAPIERGVRIALELPDGEGSTMTLAALVRYCRTVADGLWGVGVEFDESVAEPGTCETCAGPARSAH